MQTFDVKIAHRCHVKLKLEVTLGPSIELSKRVQEFEIGSVFFGQRFAQISKDIQIHQFGGALMSLGKSFCPDFRDDCHTVFGGKI